MSDNCPRYEPENPYDEYEHDKQQVEEFISYIILGLSRTIKQKVYGIYDAISCVVDDDLLNETIELLTADSRVRFEFTCGELIENDADSFEKLFRIGFLSKKWNDEIKAQVRALAYRVYDFEERNDD